MIGNSDFERVAIRSSIEKVLYTVDRKIYPGKVKLNN